MLKANFHFDYKKATQELNFFAQKEGGEINKLKALKLVYLADRYHLRKYGRLISNDTYFAMKLGPVASGVKDLAEVSEFLGEEEAAYSNRFITQTNRLILKSINSLEAEVFSDSDIEALNYVWDKFGHLDPFALAKLTHEYPDWKKHADELTLDSRIQMDISDFFDDPDIAIEQLFELDAQEKHLRREALSEYSQLESLWR
jgi:uncharacterized phage-associated protein